MSDVTIRKSVVSALSGCAEWVASVILAILFAAASDYADDTFAHLDLMFAARFLVATVVLFALFKLARAGLRALQRGSHAERNSVLDRLSCAKLVFAFAGVMLVAWLPYLILMFPGNLSNDTVGQLAMFFSSVQNDGEYFKTDQHPLFDTVVFGAIVYPLTQIASFDVGVAVCISIQAIATALSLAVALVCAYRRWHAAPAVVYVGLGFLALFPLVPLMVMSLSKDTLFAWVYVLFLLLVLDCAATESPLVESASGFAALVVVCALMALTKKLGAYIALGTLLVFLVFAWRKRGFRFGSRMLVSALVVVLLNWCVMPAVVAHTHTVPGHKIEMLAVPLSQTAMDFKRNPEAYDEHDRETVGKLIRLDAIESGQYDPLIVDSFKIVDASQPDFPTSVYTDYLHVWVDKGLDRPSTYIDGWATLVSPLFTRNAVIPLFDSGHHNWNAGYFPEELFSKSEPFQSASSALREWYMGLSSLPIVELPFQQFFCAVLVPTVFLIGAAKTRRARHFAAFVPIALSFAGLLLSSTLAPNPETMRYLIPFTYTAPLLMAYYCAFLLEDKGKAVASGQSGTHTLRESRRR